MTREALADRIVTYSDALVAFSLVNAFAFFVALGDPDIRCSITRIARIAIGMNVGFPVLVSAVLLWLHRFEQTLRGDDVQDPHVKRFWRYAHIARYALVWAFGGLVILGLAGASQDPACQAVVPGA